MPDFDANRTFPGSGYPYTAMHGNISPADSSNTTRRSYTYGTSTSTMDDTPALTHSGSTQPSTATMSSYSNAASSTWVQVQNTSPVRLHSNDDWQPLNQPVQPQPYPGSRCPFPFFNCTVSVTPSTIVEHCSEHFRELGVRAPTTVQCKHCGDAKPAMEWLSFLNHLFVHHADSPKTRPPTELLDHLMKWEKLSKETRDYWVRKHQRISSLKWKLTRYDLVLLVVNFANNCNGS